MFQIEVAKAEAARLSEIHHQIFCVLKHKAANATCYSCVPEMGVIAGDEVVYRTPEPSRSC